MSPSKTAPVFANGLSDAEKAKSAEAQAELSAATDDLIAELKITMGDHRPRQSRYERARYAGFAGSGH